ncbi:MAG: hypothetical protein ABIO94_06505 [Opitutaceae bacterium]
MSLPCPFTVFRRTAGPILTASLMLVSAAIGAETKPFELNPDRVKISDPKGLNAKTYFVPGVNLVISCSGSVWAQSKKGGGNAQAHGIFYVQGLEKSLVQELARKVQDDFVAKLRETGATVLTYEDLKSDPLVTAHGRLSPDEKWGFPTTSKSPLTYIIATPTDAQSFARGIAASPTFWLQPMAKEKKLTVLTPEITFTVPQMWGEVDSGYKRDAAGIAVNSTMLLHGASIYVNNPQGSFTHIQIQTHGQRPASEVTGTVKKLSEDNTSFSSSWGRSSSDWVMKLDPDAFSDGVLRVGYAINTYVVAAVKKAQK